MPINLSLHTKIEGLPAGRENVSYNEAGVLSTAALPSIETQNQRTSWSVKPPENSLLLHFAFAAALKDEACEDTFSIPESLYLRQLF